MKMNKEKMNLKEIRNEGEKGFTLIELIVVMAIIAILVLLAAPSFLNYTKDAKATALRQDTKVVSDAVIMYNIEEEGWPTSDGKFTKDAKINKDSLKKHVKNLSGNNEITDFVIVNKKGLVKVDPATKEDRFTKKKAKEKEGKVEAGDVAGVIDSDGNLVQSNDKELDVKKNNLEERP